MHNAPFSVWEPLPDTPSQTPTPPQSSAWALLLRGAALGLVGLAILGLLAIAAALGVYAYYARDLPSPHELYQRVTPFRSTKIYDRHGELLFEIFDPYGGRRTLVRYDDLPPAVIWATVATEDGTFFSNPGVNPFSILRALYQDLREGEVVVGGSTITQQLVKNLFLSPERTLPRKIKEAILAAEITRRYSKAEILEVYLNEVYYGNLAYGIGAAAETYFSKSVRDLTLAEAALLAGLIQSPALHDPYIDPDAALARRAVVLGLMRERELIAPEAYEAAMRQPLGTVPRQIVMQAPHMVVYVRAQLERQFGTEMLYKGGFQVYTTLDLAQQRRAEQIARERMNALREQDASNAALVAMDPWTGDILVMLGSVDFYSRVIDGQVNVPERLRQPGSTIKPFTYLAALEQGWSTSTMLMDVRQDFPDGANPPYRPRNYDDKEWGPISLRIALASSRNIPAVYTLQQVGLPALLEVAHRVGIASLNRPDYGLALTLGGGDVTLLEMTAAYAALANGGHYVAPRTILRIEDQEGNVIIPETTPALPLVMDPRHAYILTHILADDQARAPTFGANSYLNLPFPAAVKTGTTDDFRDSWTIGYTPYLVTGVWVGNNNNAPMTRVSGSRGAGLIWSDFMRAEGAQHPPVEFARPEGLVEVEVCPVSGHKHTPDCPAPRKELFLEEQIPTEDCPVHRHVAICRETGMLASEFCPPGSVEQRFYEDYGPQWESWMASRNLPIPPRQICPLHGAPLRVSIEAPSLLTADIVDLRGSTQVADFDSYVVEYGAGAQPAAWTAITARITAPVSDGVLARWDARALPDGDYTLRLVVTNGSGQPFEARAPVRIQRATATPRVVFTSAPSLTPQPTRTATARPTATPTWPSTSTPQPTFTPPPSATASPTASQTPVPTETPAPTLTPQATASPAPTATATPEPTRALSEAHTPTPTASATHAPRVTTTPAITGYPAPPSPTMIITAAPTAVTPAVIR